MINFVFKNKISDTISSLCHLNNTVSQKYLEKLGFVKQEELFMENRNVFFYLLTQKNWENKHSVG